MISHQLHQHKIDGMKKTIIQNPNEQQKKDLETVTFDTHEVYAIDVLVSTGQGKVSTESSVPSKYSRTSSLDHPFKRTTPNGPPEFRLTYSNGILTHLAGPPLYSDLDHFLLIPRSLKTWRTTHRCLCEPGMTDHG